MSTFSSIDAALDRQDAIEDFAQDFDLDPDLRSTADAFDDWCEQAAEDEAIARHEQRLEDEAWERNHFPPED